MKKALITGITGQDGSYLTELLLEKGYEVHGLVRRVSVSTYERLLHIIHKENEKVPLHLHDGDLASSGSLINLVKEIKPDEIYNLAAQSHVGTSFKAPENTANITGIGTLRLLEAIRHNDSHAKFYQASTSELYGKVQETPQTEKTPFYPRSPYACAKMYSYWITVNYRESYDMFTSNGILFNHESPRRGEDFVTRKITKAVARIKHGLQDKLYLGNLDAKRDWGHAKDYVEGMWRMLQHDKPEDFVLSTGETRSVREFLEHAFGYVDLNYEDYVEIDPKFFRPAEVDLLVGDASKAKNLLGWEPKISFKELVEDMMQSDLEHVERELKVR